MIRISKLSQAYGEKTILKDINLNIQDHKITALIGANGAGKSTLVGVISRLLKPLAGEIFIDDIDIATLSSTEIAKKLSVLKQSNPVNVNLNVRDLVAFGRYPHSKGFLKTKDHQKINEALAFMDLEAIENQALHQLSGGQRQRAFIAMILAQDSDYIFLDEPLNNLDMRYAVEMMTILERLVKELKKTVVVVIHDINIAAAFANHIVAMKDGTIAYEGDVDEIIDKGVLDHVFDHDFCIQCVNGQKICLYKTPEGIQRTLVWDVYWFY